MVENGFKVGQIFNYNGNEYIVMETIKYKNNDYCFTCKLKNDDVTKEYYIFSLKENKLSIIINNNEETKEIIGIFENLLKKKILDISNEL